MTEVKIPTQAPGSDEPLLTDDELATLFAAEYAAHGDRPTAGELRRGFDALSMVLDERRQPSRRVWVAPLAMAALVILALAPRLLEGERVSTNGSPGIKGDPDEVRPLGQPVELTAYELGTAGALTPVGDRD